MILTDSDYEEIWRDMIRHPDGKIQLAIPELLAELRELAHQAPVGQVDAYPFVLAERRGVAAAWI